MRAKTRAEFRKYIKSCGLTPSQLAIVEADVAAIGEKYHADRAAALEAEWGPGWRDLAARAFDEYGPMRGVQPEVIDERGI